MKILIVTQYFWPENFRVNDLAEGLVQRKHDVTVLTGVPNYPTGKVFEGYTILGNSREWYAGAEIVRVPLLPRGSGSRVQLALNYLSFAIASSFLGPLWCRKKYDVIIVWQPSPVTVGIPGLVFKCIKRAPMIMLVLDLWPETIKAVANIRSKAVLAGIRVVTNWIYCRADRLLVASGGFTDSLLLRGITQARLEFFPNWIEPEYDVRKDNELPSSNPSLPNGFRLMFAGSIGVAQDFDTVLTAFEELRSSEEIHLIVLGGGRRSEWLKDQVCRRGLTSTVHLLGRFPASNMAWFFSQADAMLVSLKKDPLFAITVPGKIQSYMACGKPIVAALDGEGARLIKKAGVGVVVASEDSKGLAAAILFLAHALEADRRAMGVRGREYCREHFHRAVLLDRLDVCCRDLIAGKEASSRVDVTPQSYHGDLLDSATMKLSNQSVVPKERLERSRWPLS